MRSLRFNHIFTALLVLAGLCAFVLPVRVTNPVRTSLGILFWPVAKPSGAIASWAHGKLSPQRPIDDGAPNANHPRSSDQLVTENQELRVQIGNMSGRIAQLEQITRELESVGDVRKLCKRFGVIGGGADAALREGLLITGKTFDGVKAGQPVLFTGVSGGGIAGLIDRAQVGGSVVRLVTDERFSVRAGFARFTRNPNGTVEFVTIATHQVLARGDGKGAMWIHNLEWNLVKEVDLRVDDWVIINDPDWSPHLQRYRVGRITSIDQWTKGPGYAEIKVEPPQNLLLLRDVLVMTEGS